MIKRDIFLMKITSFSIKLKLKLMDILSLKEYLGVSI